MKTLADAWEWYEATRNNLRRMRRLKTRYSRSAVRLPSVDGTSLWFTIRRNVCAMATVNALRLSTGQRLTIRWIVSDNVPAWIDE